MELSIKGLHDCGHYLIIIPRKIGAHIDNIIKFPYFSGKWKLSSTEFTGRNYRVFSTISVKMESRVFFSPLTLLQSLPEELDKKVNACLFSPFAIYVKREGEPHLV